jgi:hypothetical protein
MAGDRRFEADAEAIGAIRGYVRDTLLRHGCPDDRIDAAVLCASEVATSALLHGEGDPIEVALDLTDRARVTVRETPLVDEGAGLLLIDTFADAWGYAPTAAGTAVWFEIDLREPAPPEPDGDWRRRRSDAAGHS